MPQPRWGCPHTCGSQGQACISFVQEFSPLEWHRRFSGPWDIQSTTRGSWQLYYPPGRYPRPMFPNYFFGAPPTCTQEKKDLKPVLCLTCSGSRSVCASNMEENLQTCPPDIFSGFFQTYLKRAFQMFHIANISVHLISITHKITQICSPGFLFLPLSHKRRQIPENKAFTFALWPHFSDIEHLFKNYMWHLMTHLKKCKWPS